MAQAVEHLLCKLEAPSSNPNPTKKNKKNKKHKKRKRKGVHIATQMDSIAEHP
jgi:hypothetical protein